LEGRINARLDLVFDVMMDEAYRWTWDSVRRGAVVEGFLPEHTRILAHPHPSVCSGVA